MALLLGSTAGQECRPNSNSCDVAARSEVPPDPLQCVGETGSGAEPSDQQQTRCSRVIRQRANG